MRTIAVVVSGLALAAAGLAAACEKSPTRPSFLTPTHNPGPTPVFVSRLEIVGPRSVAPGASVQFRAIAHKSDGTTQDVTGTAAWRSTAANVLSMSPSGLATALTLGETVVQVQAEGRQSGVSVLILPDGTFRVVGLVAERESPPIPIGGALIEATGGTPPVITGADGRYRLYGVPGRAQIRVTRNGYAPQVRDIDVSDHLTLDFGLVLVEPRADISGTYQLTMSAAAECRTALPENARTRTYSAVVTQQGAQVEVTLTGGTFMVDRSGRGDGFRASIQPGRLTFSLSAFTYYYDYYADIIERLDPTSYLVIGGSGEARYSPSRIAGTLNGSIKVHDIDPRAGPRGTCRSAGHKFVFSR